jgi:hypothetical protein
VCYNAATVTKTLIKIDRSTLRRNPDAGKTEGVLSGPMLASVTTQTPSQRIAFEAVKPVSILDRSPLRIRGAFMVTEVHSTFRVGQKGAEPMIACSQPVDREFTESDECCIVLHRLAVPWRLQNPSPGWLYEYELTVVECKHCGASFFHTKLEEVEGEGYYSDRVCPKCGEPECCDIEYEQPPA